MGFPKVVYFPVGGGSTTITFKRGPSGLWVEDVARGTDNLATSGTARERVLEAVDLVIGFDMPHLVIDDDMPAWDLFVANMQAGYTFEFFPNSDLGSYWFNCIDDLLSFKLTRNAPRKYATQFQWRVLNDGHRPTNAGEVLRRFYGVTTP